MKVNNKSMGQTLIEFAFILPLLLVLVMALFDIGRAVFYYAVLNNAVREGTRFAIVQSDCEYRSNPTACSGNYVDANPTTCNVAASNGTNNICNAIEEKIFNIAGLLDNTNTTITIQHFDDGTEEPKEFYIEINISYNFSPITPGLGLIGELPLQVNSQMLKTPLAQPF